MYIDRAMYSISLLGVALLPIDCSEVCAALEVETQSDERARVAHVTATGIEQGDRPPLARSLHSYAHVSPLPSQRCSSI